MIEKLLQSFVREINAQLFKAVELISQWIRGRDEIKHKYNDKHAQSQSCNTTDMNMLKFMRLEGSHRQRNGATFSMRSMVVCKSMPKSMKVHSMPSRWYSSCSSTNMWWLKNCCNFSLVKLMHNCSKPLYYMRMPMKYMQTHKNGDKMSVSKILHENFGVFPRFLFIHNMYNQGRMRNWTILYVTIGRRLLLALLLYTLYDCSKMRSLD